MARETLVQHKARRDHSLPTPRVVWKVTDDGPGPGEFKTRFLDVKYVYRARPSRAGGAVTWAVDVVDGEDVTPRTTTSNHATWPLCRTAFQTYWTGYCDDARHVLATQDYARDHLSTEGALGTVSDSSALMSLGIEERGGVPTGIINSNFSPERLAYTYSVQGRSVALTAFTENDDQIVRWSLRNRVITGRTATLGVNEGANVILCRVTAQDGYSHRTYMLTFNRV